jgi:hypothetical protein
LRRLRGERTLELRPRNLDQNVGLSIDLAAVDR